MSNNLNLVKMTHDFAQQLLEEKSLHEYDYTLGNPALYVATYGPDEIAEIITFANETEEHREVMETYVSNYGWSKQLTWDDVSERYQGKFDSEEEFAEHIFDELYAYEMPDFARRYFDYEAFARDLFMGDYTFVDGYVFSEH